MGSRFNPSVDLGRNAPASTPPVTPLFTSHLRINFQVLRQTSEEDMGIHHHGLSFNRPMMKKGYHSSRPSSCRALGTEYVQRARRHGKVQTVLEYTGTCIVHISKPTALVTRVAPLPPFFPLPTKKPSLRRPTITDRVEFELSLLQHAGGGRELANQPPCPLILTLTFSPPRGTISLGRSMRST